MVDKSIKVGGSVGGSVTAGNIQGDILSHVGGNVSSAINELPTSSEPDNPGIKELLIQFKAAVDDPNLPSDDRKQALEQLEVLAKAGQDPNDETMKKQAKKAIGFLGVIAEGLPSAAKLVEACNQILPAIMSYFGLG